MAALPSRIPDALRVDLAIPSRGCAGASFPVVECLCEHASAPKLGIPHTLLDLGAGCIDAYMLSAFSFQVLEAGTFPTPVRLVHQLITQVIVGRYRFHRCIPRFKSSSRSTQSLGSCLLLNPTSLHFVVQWSVLSDLDRVCFDE